MRKIRTRNIKKAIETWEVDESCPEVKLMVTTETTNKVVVKEAKLTGKGPHKTHPIFVKSSFFKLISQRNPWTDGPGLKWGWEGKTIEPKDIYFGREIVSRKNLIYTYGSGHVLFDADQKPLSRAYHFDYIGTPFTNEHCDLKAMLAHLKKHPWVLNPERLIIKEVPYYNNESGRKKFICDSETGLLTVLPTQEAYEEIYEASVKERGDELFSVAMNERIHSGPPYAWKLNPYKKQLGKDYLEIRQFHKPSKVEAD